MESFSFIIIIGTIVSIVFCFFEFVQKSASKNILEKIAAWIKGVELPDADNWKNTLLNLFDTIFGPRVFKKTFFKRSCIATAISILLTEVILAIVFFFIVALTEDDSKGFVAILIFLSFAFIPAFTVNFLPDYLSLIETKLCIKEMALYSSAKALVFFIFLDFFLTTAIYLLYLSVVGATVGILSQLELFKFKVPYIEQNVSSAIGMWVFLGALIGVFSTYLTSIWIWLYGFSGLLLKFLYGLGGPILWLRDNFLDIDEKPIRSLGIVCSIILLIILMSVGLLIQIAIWL